MAKAKENVEEVAGELDGQKYELKHKHGSFYDFESELTINREEVVTLKGAVGKATHQAIANGRLVRVYEK